MEAKLDHKHPKPQLSHDEKSARGLYTQSRAAYEETFRLSKTERFSSKRRSTLRIHFNETIAYDKQLKEIQAQNHLLAAKAQEAAGDETPINQVKKHWAEFRLGQNKENAVEQLRKIYAALNKRELIAGERNGTVSHALAIAALASGRSYIEQENPQQGKEEIERADKHIKEALRKTKNQFRSNHPNHALFATDQEEITYYLGVACLCCFDAADQLDIVPAKRILAPSTKDIKTSPLADQAYQCFELLHHPKGSNNPLFERGRCEAKLRQARFMLKTQWRYHIDYRDVPHSDALSEAYNIDPLHGAIYASGAIRACA